MSCRRACSGCSSAANCRPTAFARALAQQQLALFDADDLRFDATEVRALAQLHGRLDAAPALASVQGWAAGMTLMLLGLPPGATAPTERARERLFDYFAEEVLLRLPQDELQALYATAHLPGSTGDMAAELSGYPRAGELLERLAAHSLFTDRRGVQSDKGPSSISFVFHALFSDFLRRRCGPGGTFAREEPGPLAGRDGQTRHAGRASAS